jgi:hypothetical protein
MKRCIKCFSYAFNLYKEDIDQGDLCDVHYWKEKAMEAQQEQRSDRASADSEQLDKWINLTDDELSTIEYEVYGRTLQKGKPMIVFIRQFAKAIDSALKEKNSA